MKLCPVPTAPTTDVCLLPDSQPTSTFLLRPQLDPPTHLLQDHCTAAKILTVFSPGIPVRPLIVPAAKLRSD